MRFRKARGSPSMNVIKIQAKFLHFFNNGRRPVREFLLQKGKNLHLRDFYSQEIVDSVQNLIDDDLGTSIRQIWEVAGQYRLAMVRNIVKEEIGYKSCINRRRQFSSNAVKQKKVRCRAHMKHVGETSLWPLSYHDLNPLDYFV